MANTKRPSARDRARANAQKQEELRRQPADIEQTSGSQTSDERETTGRQPADNRQTLERRNLRLPPSYWRELDAIAARDSRKVSELVREAIREYLR